jgi:hypothetical protein
LKWKAEGLKEIVANGGWKRKFEGRWWFALKFEKSF